jgi:hypothetical protein
MYLLNSYITRYSAVGSMEAVYPERSRVLSETGRKLKDCKSKFWFIHDLLLVEELSNNDISE